MMLLQYLKLNTIKQLTIAGLIFTSLTGTALAQPKLSLLVNDCGSQVASVSLKSNLHSTVARGNRDDEIRLIVRNNCRHDVFIFVDGVEVGEVKDGGKEDFKILPGEHNLEAKEERVRSRAKHHVSVIAHERFTWTLYDKL